MLLFCCQKHYFYHPWNCFLTRYDTSIDSHRPIDHLLCVGCQSGKVPACVLREVIGGGAVDESGLVVAFGGGSTAPHPDLPLKRGGEALEVWGSETGLSPAGARKILY